MEFYKKVKEWVFEIKKDSEKVKNRLEGGREK